MKIAVITGTPFPAGLAPTNRIIAYAKGLVECGHKVEVLCLYPTENPDMPLNTQPAGIYQGINFCYTSGTCIKSRSKLINWINRQKGLLGLVGHLCRLSHQEQFDAILITTFSSAAILISKFAAVKLKVPLILEKGEFPFFIRRQKKYSLHKFLYERFYFRLFDGFLVITSALKDYFRRYAKSTASIDVLPMCVDSRRFDFFNTHEKKKQIAYCGSLVQEKDGILDLLAAFEIVHKSHCDWTLAVYGGNGSEVNILKKHVQDVGLTENVLIAGHIGYYHIPLALTQASILVLPRPASVQAAGGFPTKLGEYLAAGSPVIATSVGEIPLYLSDGVNAFLVQPSDINAMSQKINFVIEHPEIADTVSKEGKKLAQTFFHYKNISGKIIQFVELLQRKKQAN